MDARTHTPTSLRRKMMKGRISSKARKLLDELEQLAGGNTSLVQAAMDATRGSKKGLVTPMDPEKARNYIKEHLSKSKETGKSIFLICPVRNCDNIILQKIDRYVRSLEEAGYDVYWPHRDTNQNDSIGVRICADNRKALAKAHEVYIWYAKGSQGSVFDLGMAFALNKKVFVVNPAT